MAAVAELADPFARCGLLVLRGAGLRLGSGWTWNSTASSTTARPGAGCGSRWASSAPNARSPGPDTLAALDAWAAVRGPQRALPHPHTGRPTDFLFCEHGGQLRPWRIRKGLDLAMRAAGLTGHQAAWTALGRPRATHDATAPHRSGQLVRRRRSRGPRRVERNQVLRILHEADHVDEAPAIVYAKLLDEAVYLCSTSTMYRIL